MTKSSENRLKMIWDKFMPLRFVIVGGWNFVFGYASFAGLYWALEGKVWDWLILTVASILGITMSFVTHRILTYKSHGVWWKEYLRFYIVYGGQTLLNIGLFWLLVTVMKLNAYAVQFILTVLITFATYWAHKRFSFKEAK